VPAGGTCGLCRYVVGCRPKTVFLGSTARPTNQPATVSVLVRLSGCLEADGSLQIHFRIRRGWCLLLRPGAISASPRGTNSCQRLNGSNEIALASADSLHQRLDPLPTYSLVVIADRLPVQHIAKRNRIK
jgi:hypothetical protein